MVVVSISNYLVQDLPNGGDFSKLGTKISKGAKGGGNFKILGDFKTLKCILDILKNSDKIKDPIKRPFLL